jgi:hypothetical protein
MNPVFFGTSGEPLFGVFHAPVRAASSRVAALLCPPLGQEYLRSHRALRQLAVQLAREGIAAFRFDYRGTGDSFGDAEMLTFETMHEDAQLACTELLDLSGARKAAVIGLRAGGIPALRLAGDRTVSACVLWDPILDGSVYAASLAEGGRIGDAVWHMGFPYAEPLLGQIRAYRLDCAGVRKPVTLVLPSPADAADVVSTGGDTVQAIETGERSEWWTWDNEGSLIVPGRGTRIIVDLLADAGRAA